MVRTPSRALVGLLALAGTPKPVETIGPVSKAVEAPGVALALSLMVVRPRRLLEHV